MHSENLFTNYSQIENNAPLADKLRPKNLEDFFGQQSILNENSLLRSAILKDKISNCIFSGPPGVGKTTLIEIISFNTRSKLIKLNAVLSSVKELRNAISDAKESPCLASISFGLLDEKDTDGAVALKVWSSSKRPKPVIEYAWFFEFINEEADECDQSFKCFIVVDFKVVVDDGEESVEVF